jgi:hypothetical protein
MLAVIRRQMMAAKLVVQPKQLAVGQQMPLAAAVVAAVARHAVEASQAEVDFDRVSGRA